MSTKTTMQPAVDLDLVGRIETLAERTQQSERDIVDAALRGYLDWQDELVNRVQQGIDAADRGDFATAEEVERVFDKYRPA